VSPNSGILSGCASLFCVPLRPALVAQPLRGVAHSCVACDTKRRSRRGRPPATWSTPVSGAGRTMCTMLCATTTVDTDSCLLRGAPLLLAAPLPARRVPTARRSCSLPRGRPPSGERCCSRRWCKAGQQPAVWGTQHAPSSRTANMHACLECHAGCLVLKLFLARTARGLTWCSGAAVTSAFLHHDVFDTTGSTASLPQQAGVRVPVLPCSRHDWVGRPGGLALGQAGARLLRRIRPAASCAGVAIIGNSSFIQRCPAWEGGALRPQPIAPPNAVLAPTHLPSVVCSFIRSFFLSFFPARRWWR
jgi:hypothetical protein